MTPSSPRKIPVHLLVASLLFSAKTASFTFRQTRSTVMTSTARRSSRLQKRSLVSNVNDATTTSNQYGSMKVAELRALLRQRGLAVSGVKSVLVERLTSTSATKLPSTINNDDTQAVINPQPKVKRARKKSALESIPQSKTPSQAPSAVDCLPRTRELQLQFAHKDSDTNLAVIGVDEAGRGPLAGPVVAAAAIVPTNIAGIVDSKKITKEEERERLYEELIACPDIRYAVAVVSAQRIDEINILQATLEGMRMAVEGVMSIDSEKKQDNEGNNNVASAERNDVSYVITGGGGTINKAADESTKSNNKSCSYHALIDGNKVPKEMPCPSESLVKGDGREYSIGAASILAKVTRDRLMHEYDKKYPEFNLSQHKGYPTAAHMSAVREFGASPIHRRTFAPLKHMEFDDDGKIIG
ncbi:hypothetical protein ACHAXR_008741 [Thalassiosira sp. AJA248-18]